MRFDSFLSLTQNRMLELTFFWSLIIFSDGKFEAKTDCEKGGVYKEK